MNVVRTREMAWESGLEVVASMAPAWRDNLGPAEQVDACYAKYNQKRLVHDGATSYRGDLVRVDSGYADLTDAYHDSAEECLFLAGGCTLSGEGRYAAGDYFWRPPGFVHSAISETGFTALIFVQGQSPSEGSGRASRVIRPRSEAGTNPCQPNVESAVGPRGWVRVSTWRLPWSPGPAWARTDGNLLALGLEGMSMKVLSRNVITGAQTVLVQLRPGYSQNAVGALTGDLGCYVLEGSVVSSDVGLDVGCWAEWSAGEYPAHWSTQQGALLFCRVGGRHGACAEE